MTRATKKVQPRLELDPDVRPASQRLVQAVIRALARGDLADGDEMPSTRLAATTYGIARSSVVEAYEVLCGGGLLTAEQGSGTRVSHGAAALAGRSAQEDASGPDPGRSVAEVVNLTVPGTASAEVMDLRDWNRAWRDAVRLEQPCPGHEELTGALAKHLRSFRGVQAAPGQLVLRPSLRSALADIVHGAGLHGRCVAIEDPGPPRLRRMLLDAGCRVHLIPVDDEGLRAGLLTSSDAAVYVTPARQWPTGVGMTPERRTELFQWAQRTGGLVIEDDQDAEFTYGLAPQPTLFSTAPADVTVAHLGSTSKLVDSDLHVHWLVMPQGMRPLPEDHAPVSGFTARALARYIESGAFYRHRNRANHVCEERRTALLAQIEKVAPGVRAFGDASGTEVLLVLPDGVDELYVQRRIEDAGFAVSTMGDFSVRHHSQGLLVEFSHLSPVLAKRFADALAAAMGSSPPGRPARTA